MRRHSEVEREVPVTPRDAWPQTIEWFDEARSGRRWIDALTLVARVADDECLGKTRDLSLGGLGAILQGLHPAPRATIEVDVVFPGEVQNFRGEVVHAANCGEETLVGVRLHPPAPGLRRFLEARYGQDSGGSGKVT